MYTNEVGCSMIQIISAFAQVKVEDIDRIDLLNLVVVYDGQKKYNFRNNTDYQIGKYVKIETGISYDYKITDVPTYGIGYGLQDMWIYHEWLPCAYQLDFGYYG